MGYVKNTLAPGEEYRYRARFNWTYDFATWFWFLLGCVPAAFWVYLFVKNYIQIPPDNLTFAAFTIASLFFGGLIMMRRYVHKWTTVIAITSLRLILKTGLVARESHEVNLDKIEEVLVHQSFLGRILGYGVLTIRGTGIAVIEFPILARPMEVRREIETAVAAARGALKQAAQQTDCSTEGTDRNGARSLAAAT